MNKELEEIYENIKEGNIFKKIRRIAEVTRREICTGYACSIPKALCLQASKKLFLNFKKNNFNPILVMGNFHLDEPYTSDDYDDDVDYDEIYDALHYWVELPDYKLIVDITADQFNDEIHNDPYPYIVIGTYDEYDRYTKINYKQNITESKLDQFDTAISSNEMFKNGVLLLKKLKEIDPNSENIIVGGTVRDLLLGKEINDVDIATNIPMDVIEKHFKVDEIGKSKDFGILNVHFNGFQYEVANFREDIGYSDNRRPDEVRIAKSFKEDSSRRDATINALGIDENGEMVDYHNGIEDLKNKLIRAVGDARKRFEEDSLRIIRFLRFSAKFGFDIEENTKKAMIELAHLTDNLSKERIAEELYKVASNGEALANYLEKMDEIGLLQRILPEIKLTQKYFHHPGHHPEGATVEAL